MTTHSRSRAWWLIVGILLISLSMRMPVTASGALTAQLQEELAVSASAAGFLTTVVVLVFAAASPLMGALGRRFGLNRVLLAGLCLVVGGQCVRVLAGYGVFLLGTVILALGLTSANVLLPPLIRLAFPRHIGLLTSVYLSLMDGASGVAAGLVLPLAAWPVLGWRGALLVWMPVAAVAALSWLPLQKAPLQARAEGRAAQGSGDQALSLRQPLIWQVVGYMGLQSFLYYSLVSWLPAMLGAGAVSVERVAFLVFSFQMWNIPGSFVAPIMAARLRNQSWLGLASGLAYLSGVLLLLSGRGGFTLDVAMLLLGFGGGSTIGLAVLFFNLRTRSVAAAGQLSGLAQGVGYALAAAGPVLVGLFKDIAGSWHWPLILLAGAGCLLSISGWLAGRDRLIGE